MILVIRTGADGLWWGLRAVPAGHCRAGYGRRAAALLFGQRRRRRDALPAR